MMKEREREEREKRGKEEKEKREKEERNLREGAEREGKEKERLQKILKSEVLKNVSLRKDLDDQTIELEKAKEEAQKKERESKRTIDKLKKDLEEANRRKKEDERSLRDEKEISDRVLLYSARESLEEKTKKLDVKEHQLVLCCKALSICLQEMMSVYEKALEAGGQDILSQFPQFSSFFTSSPSSSPSSSSSSSSSSPIPIPLQKVGSSSSLSNFASCGSLPSSSSSSFSPSPSHSVSSSFSHLPSSPSVDVRTGTASSLSLVGGERPITPSPFILHILSGCEDDAVSSFISRIFNTCRNCMATLITTLAELRQNRVTVSSFEPNDLVLFLPSPSPLKYELVVFPSLKDSTRYLLHTDCYEPFRDSLKANKPAFGYLLSLEEGSPAEAFLYGLDKSQPYFKVIAGPLK